MSPLRFTEEHEWIRVEGDTATIGISPYAQEQLGDVVFVDLPQPGKKVEKGKEVAVVESVKAASEVRETEARQQGRARRVDGPGGL